MHVGTTHVNPRLDELTFTTPALVGETKVRILLPEGYDPAGDDALPRALPAARRHRQLRGLDDAGRRRGHLRGATR